ncbi:MAG: hypothetical protein OHK0047_37530 [Leptolyngbyaceae cyanobacterium]|uniref:DUF433 domain-containing protein n=1 Tax=Leptodesmis sichuanensis TaxID=2906798 RepID=UPI001F15752A|nr:DUF433 domain-containing protein [Leptodesmis sichuanensis]UIE38763.1 DUF433 domain-containing protein [Leptodesmis sichuanensis A121]
MSVVTTSYRYIQLDDRQVPFIEGTSMKVAELITSVQAYGWNPEQLLENYPHLTLSKIHSALAYYWDHQTEIDAAIAQREQYSAELETAAGESPFATRLRDQGLLP